jgi:hypothetical protein
MDEQQWGWIGDRFEQRWVGNIVESHQVVTRLFKPGQIVINLTPIRVDDGADGAGREPQRGQSRMRLTEQFTWRLDFVQQIVKSFNANPGRAQQGQPVTLFFGIDRVEEV